MFLVMVLRLLEQPSQGSHSLHLPNSRYLFFLFFLSSDWHVFSPPICLAFLRPKSPKDYSRKPPHSWGASRTATRCTSWHSGGFWKIWAADSAHPYLEKSVRKLSSAGKNTTKSKKEVILRHTALKENIITEAGSPWPNPEEVKRDRQGQWPVKSHSVCGHKAHGWTEEPSKYTQPIKYNLSPGNAVIKMAWQNTRNREEQDPPLLCTIWGGWIIHLKPCGHVFWHLLIGRLLWYVLPNNIRQMEGNDYNIHEEKKKSWSLQNYKTCHGHYKMRIHPKQSILSPNCTKNSPTLHEHTWASMSPPSIVRNSQSESACQKPRLTPLVGSG